jgi:hypothetical protein
MTIFLNLNGILFFREEYSGAKIKVEKWQLALLKVLKHGQ